MYVRTMADRSHKEYRIRSTGRGRERFPVHVVHGNQHTRNTGSIHDAGRLGRSPAGFETLHPCRAGQRRGSIPRQSHKGTPGRKVRRRSIQMELPDTWMQGPIGSLYEVWQRGSGREDPKSNQQRRADRHRGGQYPGSSRGSTCELKTAGRLDLFRKGNQRD